MPNVLMIVADDLRPQLGCYGWPVVKTPHIDALAADGIAFRHAYCQQAVCAPSRASVLSGCRPDTTRIFDLDTPLNTTLPDCVTLPGHFRRNGYRSVAVGKIYHHRLEDPHGWSEEPHVTKGDWKGRGYLTDEAIEAMNAHLARLGARGDRRNGLGPATECADVDDDAYHDGREALKAIEQLNALKDGPFFLAVGFHKPHLPFNAPKRYWDLYDRATVPLAANPFPIAGAHPWTVTDFGELRGYSDMPAKGPISEADARRLVHGYLACISYVDAQIGRVIAELERLGLRDDTVICLWGDHGWKLGEHASWCKHTNTEIDTNAPLIIATPETRGRGAVSEALVEFVDIYPTLSAACGLDIPAHCEGASLMPLLHHPQRPGKRAAFSQYPRGGNPALMGCALRDDRFRYVEWRPRDGSPCTAFELYDHQVDPQENRNVVDDPAYAQARAACAALMQAGWRDAKGALA